MSEIDPELRKEVIVESMQKLADVSNVLNTLMEEQRVSNITYQVPLVTSDNIVSAYRNLPFSEKNKVYSALFSLDNLGNSIDNKLILMSLIVSFTLMARKKNPELSVLDCVKRLVDVKTYADPLLAKKEEEYIETLAIIADDYLFNVEKGNTFGLKNAAELKSKVNEILQTRLPF